ncbi:hypothetical protein PPROV_000502600 [Pycnococcus provasolii]|uniref:Uncharacterized protein n=1 Tax=Pycnococcus provasolii TaxID=41880 RepID=A0A830HM51_9CHLO|nr:hypothetical protein PPROV_000502600 [Pycnococcus provasolii]
MAPVCGGHSRQHGVCSMAAAGRWHMCGYEFSEEKATASVKFAQDHPTLAVTAPQPGHFRREFRIDFSCLHDGAGRCAMRQRMGLRRVEKAKRSLRCTLYLKEPATRERADPGDVAATAQD